MCPRRGYASSSRRGTGQGAFGRALPSSDGLTRELENVRLKGDSGVELHDLSQRASRVDVESRTDDPKDEVVLIEEAVAIADRCKLLLPHRELELPELGAAHVTLGDHTHESVEPVDRAVERLQARGHRAASSADHHLLLGRLGTGSDEVPVRIPEFGEIEDVRVVDRVLRVDQWIRGEPLRGFASDLDEGRLRR